jgi:hypothetical protein
MKKSIITNLEFIEIENELKLTLPQDFKTFYSSYYSLENDFDVSLMTITGNKENDNLNLLKESIFKNGFSITNFGLIPFGFYNDTYFICLDMNTNLENPKISLFDMYNWRAGVGAISKRHWFSSFRHLLICSIDYMKIKDYKNFNILDPENNFTNAYDYWIR